MINVLELLRDAEARAAAAEQRAKQLQRELDLRAQVARVERQQRLRAERELERWRLRLRLRHDPLPASDDWLAYRAHVQTQKARGVYAGKGGVQPPFPAQVMAHLREPSPLPMSDAERAAFTAPLSVDVLKRALDWLDKMTDAEVDAELRTMGEDPDAVAARGLAFVQRVKQEVIAHPTPEASSEAMFERLAAEDPARLLRLLKSDLSPGHLTHAAEIAGRNLSSEVVVPTLLELLEHPSPLVREGAVYGLAAHRSKDVDAALLQCLKSDASPGVRLAIEGGLEDL